MMPIEDDLQAGFDPADPVHIGGGLPPSVFHVITGKPMTDPGASVGGEPPHPIDWGGLPNVIPQHMGWAATTAPVASTSTDPGTVQYFTPHQALPTSIAPSQPAAPTQPAPPPTPRQPRAVKNQIPTRAPTFDQRVDTLEQRAAGTEAEQRAAIDAGVAAEHNLTQNELGAYNDYRTTTAATATQRQAEADAYAKLHATNDAKMADDRKAIESWKFNRNQFMDELGVGGKVRWGIGMVLAGIGQGMMRQGGANPVVEMLQQQIHEANDAQMKKRDALVQQLGFDREGQQDATAYHAQRQAEIDKKDGLAGVALAKSLEEAALKSADPLARARGMKAAADVRAMSDQQLKGYVEMRSQHDLQAQQNAISGGHLAETIRHNKVQESFEYAKMNAESELKAAALAAKQQGKLSDEESKRAIFIPGPDGAPVAATKKNGDLVLAAEPGAADTIRRQVAATSTYNALVNQMVKGIREHGGESGWLRSDDWQRMQSDYKSAIAELHDAYKVTSFREPTIKFFDDMASSVDPTSFVRDATAGLQESKHNVQMKLNLLLRDGQGYDGPPITFPDSAKEAPPTQTEEQRVLARGLLNPHRGFRDNPGVLATEVGKYSPRGDFKPDETLDTRLKDAGEILPSVRQAMVTAGAALNSPDLAIRRHYYEVLDNLAKNSESPETAAFAKLLLDRAQAQQFLDTPGAANAPEAIRGADGRPGSQ